MGSSEDRHTQVLVKVIEKSLMMPGNYKYVARVHGLQVHESHNETVCVPPTSASRTPGGWGRDRMA